MEPSVLMRSGFDSIFSNTVSKRGAVWAIPHPSQLLPRFLLRFKKVPQDSLWGVVSQRSALPLCGFNLMPAARGIRFNTIIIKKLSTLPLKKQLQKVFIITYIMSIRENSFSARECYIYVHMG